VFSYDANGNIITQLRNGTAASGLSMDNLQYNYYTSTGSTYNPATATPTNATNKLAYVDDSGTSGNYADDLEDQSAGNYTYDATGQLTSDAAEQIANIEWTVYGKIKNITRTAGSTKKELTFKYDALGQRVMKLAKDRDASGVMTQENWTYTYYVRDAQGNVMATYKRSLTANITTQQATDKLVLEESHIYGSSRLGVDDRETENINSTNTFAWSGGYTAEGELIPAAVPVQSKMAAVNMLTPKRKLGLKLYELSNHLGNVLVTVSDRKLTKQLGTSTSVEYYMADVRSTSDYSVFGVSLIGRKYSFGTYKYGFNGIELEDNYCQCQDFYNAEYRIYDSRLARWLSTDPEEVHFEDSSPYNNNDNSPIINSDPDGDCPWCVLFVVGMVWDVTSQMIAGKDITEIDWADAALSGVETALPGAKFITAPLKAAVDISASKGVQSVFNGKKSIEDATRDLVVDLAVSKVSDKVFNKMSKVISKYVDDIGAKASKSANHAQNMARKAEKKPTAGNVRRAERAKGSAEARRKQQVKAKMAQKVLTDKNVQEVIKGTTSNVSQDQATKLTQVIKQKRKKYPKNKIIHAKF
jgi:RHS repeat-associated protein